MSEMNRGYARLTISAKSLEDLLPIVVPFQIDNVTWDPITRNMVVHISADGLFEHRLHEHTYNINLEDWAKDAIVALKAINISEEVKS